MEFAAAFVLSILLLVFLKLAKEAPAAGEADVRRELASEYPGVQASQIEVSSDGDSAIASVGSSEVVLFVHLRTLPSSRKVGVSALRIKRPGSEVVLELPDFGFPFRMTLAASRADQLLDAAPARRDRVEESAAQ